MYLSVGGPVVVDVELDAAAVLVVQDLDGALLADPVAHLARVYPDGQVLGQVFQDVLYGHAALPGRLLEHGIDGRARFDASVCGPTVRFLRVPVAGELFGQTLFQFLAEYVHPAPGQLIVQVRDHKVQRYADFDMHLVTCDYTVNKKTVDCFYSTIFVLYFFFFFYVNS